MQSLLSAILIILIILVVLVVFIPAYLERQSRRNQASRQRHTDTLQAHERKARQLERVVSPYGRGRSAHFQQGTAEARERLSVVLAGLDGAGSTLKEMRCPEVYDYLLPAQHFLIAPRDISIILADSRRAARLREQFRQIDLDSAALEETVTALTGLPARLEGERKEFAARLNSLETTLRGERAAGVTELDDLEQELNRLRQLLARQQVTSTPDADLPAIDEGAMALEDAATGTMALEERITTLTRSRTQLDERLAKAIAALDDLQLGAKGGPETTVPDG